ncbi:AraC family transcriptional regulator [Butyricicoccus sp.]|uniref:AraC family transcriptional regulator n=1 Tax=Butyricicoccus sp. TaxID=2049021 RepID=UPI003F184167
MYKDNFTHRQIMTDHLYEYHHYRNDTPPEIDFHQHEFYEIYLFISGSVNYIIEGRTYKLQPGDILLTNNSDIHRPEILPSDQPYERSIIWLDEDFFRGMRLIGEDLTACFKDAARRNYRLIRPTKSQLAQIQKLCEILEFERASNQIGNRVMAYSAIATILVLLSRAYYDTPDSAQKDITESDLVNQIITYINEHLAEDLTLDDLADHFYVSKYHLSHQFKQFTGLSLYQYIMKKRLTIARNMLMTGTPVTTVYTKCGFNDYSNFLKAFKREFGMNPSDYTKKSK